ncbi:MAG: M56 family metallopeptidase [Rhizobium sp.]|nr:M56 family metallopeptidase [Rhizobium sp.]
MNLVDTLVSFQLTLWLHATVLLAAAWLLERSLLRRHPGWAELAWRGALFAALLSASLSVLGPAATRWLPAPASAEPAATARPTLSAVSHALPGAIGVARATPAPVGDAAPAARTETTSAPAFETTDPGPMLELPSVLVLALLLPWSLALAFAALRFGLQWRSLRQWARRLRDDDTAPSPELASQARRLAGDLRLAQPPSLHVVAGLASPMLLPGGRLLLPEWVDDLPAPQRRALLAHELTHVQRQDPAWRLAQRLAALPLVLHPLARHALRRLEALAEDACDARAAELCGSGRPLAECLATCLSHAGDRAGTPTLAVAMADDTGPVVRRVQNLLEDTPVNRPIPTALRRGALVLGITAAIALPGLAITSVASDAFANSLFDGMLHGSRHVSYNGRDSWEYTNAVKGERLKLVVSGEVTFAPDDSGIVAMADGAEFELFEKSGGVTRSLEVENVAGKLEHRYELDGDSHAFDADARAWLARTLLHAMRETGMQAETRGKRLLAAGGPDALLAEVDRIESGYSRARYLAVLFAEATLDDAQLDRALAIAGKIGSDYELRRALEGGLTGRTLSPAHQAKLLSAAAGISSDYEQAQLLVALAASQTLEGPVLAAWRTVLDGIASDYEQRRVLMALLENGSPAAVSLALESAANLGSDYEARQLLAAAAPATRDNPETLAAYLRVVEGIGSDYEHRQALQHLVEAGPVDLAVADGVLASLGGMGSGYEIGQALQALAAVMPADPGLVERYRAVARRLADHERGQAEKALDRFAVARVD